MDGRHFYLNQKIKDRSAHRKVARLSNICVMYIMLSVKIEGLDQTMEMATAVTAGTMNYLYIGKTGIFFSHDGHEWDAEIIDIIENPVSLIEAVWMPFKRLGAFIGKQAEKFGKSHADQFEKKLGKSLDAAEKSISAPKTKESQADQALTGNLKDLMLTGGITIAAMGSALAFITKTLKSVTLFDMLSIFGCLIVIIILPTLIIAMIKLRRRDLSLFLEANGWSINGPIRLTRRMGLFLTRGPKWPKNAKRRSFFVKGGHAAPGALEEYEPRERFLCLLLSALLGLIVGYAINRYWHVSDCIVPLLSGS